MLCCRRVSSIMSPPDARDEGGFVRALTNPNAPPPEAIGTDQKRRFDIYRNNVTHGLIEALGASFPAVQALVGEAFFGALAKAYLAENPARSPLLFRFGGTFGAFIDGFEPVRGLPYLGDVARLEWARLQAHHGADAEPIALDALAAVPPEQLTGTRLALHPTATVLRSCHPVYSLWAASSGVEAAPEVELSRAETALVHRPILDVQTRLLAPGSAAFLSTLADGHPLGPAAEAANQADPAFDLASELSGVFSIGAIVAITPPDD